MSPFRFVGVSSPFRISGVPSPLRFLGVSSPFRLLESRLHSVFSFLSSYFPYTLFHLVSAVPFPRLNGGVLLGPLPLVTSVHLVRVPNPLACAYS